MDTPDWLPVLIASNYRRMLSEGVLTDKKVAFFTDEKLKRFWEKASAYLTHENHRPPACSLVDTSDYFVGVFLAPLKMYSDVGTADRPTVKTNIRKAQRKADKLFDKAQKLAVDLAGVLDEIKGVVVSVGRDGEIVRTVPVTRYYPEEIASLMAIVRKMSSTDDDSPPWPAHIDRLDTSEAILCLAESLEYYPRTDDLFNDTPGMKSQKATWHDWLREVSGNIEIMLRIYPGNFELAEVDWVNLAQVLIDSSISREAVQKALKQI